MPDLELTAHLAELSKIEFSAPELEDMANDMQNIIELMDKVKLAADCDFFHSEALDIKNLRPDLRKVSFPVREILQNAKNTCGDSFTVPKVL